MQFDILRSNAICIEHPVCWVGEYEDYNFSPFLLLLYFTPCIIGTNVWSRKEANYGQNHVEVQVRRSKEKREV